MSKEIMKMPDCWAVVKDGQIIATHDEPFHVDGIQSVRYVPAPVQQEHVANEQDAFEQKFPMPRHCSRFTGGYAPTSYNAWEAQTHCLRWEGWKARANTTPPQQEPVALREAFASVLDGVYVCDRVWSAWGVGTMSQNDFYPAAESDDVLESLVQAAITASPRREWVGLTDEEIWPWFQENTALTNESAMRIVRAIEAAHDIKEDK